MEPRTSLELSEYPGQRHALPPQLFASRVRMPRSPDPASLHVLQQEAERMARLSPFAADRDRFSRIARRYREEAEGLMETAAGRRDGRTQA